jgi:release factor glutamine methyltransferase
MLKRNTYSVWDVYNYLLNVLKPAWGEETEALSKFILKEILNVGITDMARKASLDLSDEVAKKMEEVVHRLKKMEPIQYILGYAYFLERKFKVNHNVLIPRTETEELVIMILEKNITTMPKILDIGVGTGCIGISLAIETGVFSFTGLDYDQSVIDVAEVNANNLGVKMKDVQIDLLNDQIPGSGYDIIVSNPPYVLPSEKKFMRKNIIDFEPGRALYVPENDPLIFYNRIVKYASGALNNNGLLCFEINESLGSQVMDLMLSQAFSEVEIKKDIHDRERFVFGRFFRH